MMCVNPKAAERVMFVYSTNGMVMYRYFQLMSYGLG